MRRTLSAILPLLCCLAAAAQSSPDLSGPIWNLHLADEKPGPTGLHEPLANVPPAPADVVPPDPNAAVETAPAHIDWTRTGQQSFFFLGIQHSVRLVQKKTRRELGGKFFAEWVNAVDGLSNRWGDGDSMLTNYVGHPMMGAISGYTLIQNDPHGRGREFDTRDMRYWNSRLRAMGWAAFYSTQFELGPVSEATIGHVGKKPGTAGAVDLVMTPIGGFGWIVAEDATDKHWIKKIEQGRSDGFKRAVRIFFNPNRSVANVLRLKKPWHRDTRSMSWDQ